MMTSFPTTTTSSGSNLATVAALQAMACSGLIRLHGPFSLHDEDSRAKVFGMAQRVVASARELESGNEIYWHLPLSVRPSILANSFSGSDKANRSDG
jgi:hypothetical protein